MARSYDILMVRWGVAGLGFGCEHRQGIGGFCDSL